MVATEYTPSGKFNHKMMVATEYIAYPPIENSIAQLRIMIIKQHHTLIKDQQSLAIQNRFTRLKP